MTAKQIYEATAIELSKIQAPTLKLYEFNYFFNQAIRQYVNKIYNIYDLNQQTTDDLRVLKATATLLPYEFKSTGNTAIDYLHRGTYFVDMPDDYLHLLNCICLFNVNKIKDCWNEDDVMVVGATKLTADSWSSIVDDVYNRPSKKHPYYYIHNQNDIYLDSNYELTAINSELPTNIDSTTATVPSGNATDKLHDYDYSVWHAVLDAAKQAALTATAPNAVIIAAQGVADITQDMATAITNVSNSLAATATANDAYTALLAIPAIASGTYNFERTFTFNGVANAEDAVEKSAGIRHANSSKVRIEIRCGRDKSNVFSLSAVQIDYVKAPQYIRLTQEQLDSDEDISQIMEFPDYVNQEIINELVNLIMRKTNDPSLNAHIQMTQSIARPTGQSQQTAAQA